MPPTEFKPAIPATEWPETYALDHARTLGLALIYSILCAGLIVSYKFGVD
jgi:hypothetical protein